MNTLFAILLLSACVATVFSVTCYTCTMCSDTFNEADQGDATDCTYCKKNKAGAAGVYTVTRSCVDSCTEFTLDFFGIYSKDTCCQTDYCNGASSVVISLTALFVPSLLAFIRNLL